MKKHIVGIIIFTLIVGTSAVIFGLFGSTKVNKSFCNFKSGNELRVYKKKKRKKRRHRRHRHHNHQNMSVEISNAAYDKRSEELFVNLDVASVGYRYEENVLPLNFYTEKDGKMIYAGTVKTNIRTSTKLIVKKIEWLNDLSDSENLYVVAGNSLTDTVNSRLLDDSKAIPVLMKAED